MSLLERIIINNFRGFNSLEINKLNQINLFIGKNNSGKSSILESIFLLVGMSNPLLPDNINRMRGLNIKSAEDFKYLFHKLKINNIPEFEAYFNDETKRTLKLNPIFKKGIGNSQSLTLDEFSIDASSSTPNITGLELKFSHKLRHAANKTFKSSIVFNPPEIIQNQNNQYKIC